MTSYCDVCHKPLGNIWEMCGCQGEVELNYVSPPPKKKTRYIREDIANKEIDRLKKENARLKQKVMDLKYAISGAILAEGGKLGDSFETTY